MTLASPSIQLFVSGLEIVLIGAGDGKLYQIDVGGASVKSVAIGSGGAGVGSPSLDVAHSVVYVGTEAGTVHAVRVPLP